MDEIIVDGEGWTVELPLVLLWSIRRQGYVSELELLLEDVVASGCDGTLSCRLTYEDVLAAWKQLQDAHDQDRGRHG